MHAKLFSLFKNNALLQGLTDEELKILLTEGKRLLIKEGSTLIKDGDPANEMFLLIDGSLAVSKRDATTGTSHILAHLTPGDLVGEMALIDKGKRSADVIALSDAELIGIPFEQLDVESLGHGYLMKVILRIAQNISTKLRKTSSTALDALQKQVEEFKNRVFLADLFTATIFLVCSYIFLMQGIKEFATLPKAGFSLTLPLTLFFLFGLVYFVKTHHLPWRMFGLTMDNWKRALFEGFVFTIPLIALSILGKSVIDHLTTPVGGEVPPLILLKFTPLATTLYTLCIVPLQELLARGGMQGLLVRFLTGKQKKLRAIFIASLIFGTCHLFISFKIAFAVFLYSLYFGWLYARTNTLISSWVAHSMLGILAFNILGV